MLRVSVAKNHDHQFSEWGGQEAVHALPGRDAPQVLGAAGAQGAADVGDRLVGEAVASGAGLARAVGNQRLRRR